MSVSKRSLVSAIKMNKKLRFYCYLWLPLTKGYTNKFTRYVVDLSRIGTIKDVALFLNISWDTVKDIQMNRV